MLSRTRERHVVDLSAYRNNVGCCAAGFDAADGFDGFGRSYASEDLASVRDLVGGWPAFWGNGAPDNVQCDGQDIALATPPLIIDSLGFLGAACGGRLHDDVVLRGPNAGDGVQVAFALSDFLAYAGTPEEVCEVVASSLREHGRDVPGPSPRLWRVEVPLARPAFCSTVRLPINPGLHLFGLWVGTSAGTDAG